MAEKKRFLLRIEPDAYTALEKWAADDLRSVNAQIEFLLKEALAKAGRSRTAGGRRAGDAAPPERPPAGDAADDPADGDPEA